MKNRKTYLQLMKGYLGKRGWKKLTVQQRKELRQLAKLQQDLAKHFRKLPKEEYVNINAQIEYDRYEGLR